MSNAPTSPLLAALRAGTRDLHDRTEAACVLSGADVTRAEYAAVLVRLVGYYARAEAALAAWAPALALLGLDLGGRRKAHLARRDRAFAGALDRFHQATPAAGRAAVHARGVDAARAAFLVFERDVVAPTARPASRPCVSA